MRVWVSMVPRESIFGFRFGQEFGDAEIENLDPVIARDEDVFRLQIAMDDQLFMGGDQRLGNLPTEFGGLPNRKSGPHSDERAASYPPNNSETM